MKTTMHLPNLHRYKGITYDLFKKMCSAIDVETKFLLSNDISLSANTPNDIFAAGVIVGQHTEHEKLGCFYLCIKTAINKGWKLQPQIAFLAKDDMHARDIARIILKEHGCKEVRLSTSEGCDNQGIYIS